MNANRVFRLAFHSENGPGIGGSDIKMGHIANGLDPNVFATYLLAREAYPVGVVFGSDGNTSHIIDGLAANAKPTTNEGSSTHLEAATLQSRTRLNDVRTGMRRMYRAVTPISFRVRIGYARVAERVKRIVRSYDIDIFQTMDGGAQPVVVGAKRGGALVVSHYAAPPPVQSTALTRNYARVSARCADVLIGASHFNARAWAEFIGIDVANFRVIHNGVKVPVDTCHDRIVARDIMELPHNARVVGMTSRLTMEKGIFTFVQAAIGIAAIDEQVHFAVVGAGEAEQQAKDMVSQAGLSRRFRFMGFRRDAPLLTSAYDIAVVPSICQEAFGNTIIEAMARGVAVVASEVGGIPEVIKNEHSGILVPPGDSDALARVLKRLMECDERRAELGVSGLQEVKRRFAFGRMLDEYKDVYLTLLRTRKGG